MTTELFKKQFDSLQALIEDKENHIQSYPNSSRRGLRAQIHKLKVECKKLDRDYWRDLMVDEEEKWWTLYSQGYIVPKTDKEKAMVVHILKSADEFFQQARIRKAQTV